MSPELECLLAEIGEQPVVVARLLDEQLEAVRQIARTISNRDPSAIVLVARGSSDNAAVYGRYLFGDYCGGWIHVFDSSTGQASSFLDSAASIVDIHAGDDGNLYYLDRGRTSLLQVSYSSNLLPVIDTQPKSQLVSAGYTVTFGV